MGKLVSRYLIVILLLLATATAVGNLRYSADLNNETSLKDILAIPMRLGDFWQGQDFPLEEMVYEILETRAIIHRSFFGPQNENVFLSVVHYADTKVDFHAPEACLGGLGQKTTKNNKQILLLVDGERTLLDVAEIVATRTNGKSLTYYFYKSGEFIGSSYIQLRLNIATNKLLRDDARGSLIRVSTDFSPQEKAKAEKRLTLFLNDLLPYVYEIP